MSYSTPRTSKSLSPSTLLHDQLGESIFRSNSHSDTKDSSIDLFSTTTEQPAHEPNDGLGLSATPSGPSPMLQGELSLAELAEPVLSSELQVQHDFFEDEMEHPGSHADAPDRPSPSKSPAFLPSVDGPADTRAAGSDSHSTRNSCGGTRYHDQKPELRRDSCSLTPTPPLNSVTKRIEGPQHQSHLPTSTPSSPNPPHQHEQPALKVNTPSATENEIPPDLEPQESTGQRLKASTTAATAQYSSLTQCLRRKRPATSPPRDMVMDDQNTEPEPGLTTPRRSEQIPHQVTGFDSRTCSSVADGATQPLGCGSRDTVWPQSPGYHDACMLSQEPTDTPAQREPGATSNADDLTQVNPPTSHPIESPSDHEKSKPPEPCVRCLRLYAKGKEVDCTGPATHSLSQKRACPECARQNKACQAFPKLVMWDVRKFWHDRPRHDFDRRRIMKIIKQKMLLEDPVTRKEAEEEKCRELLLVASRASEAGARARRMEQAIAHVIPSIQ